MEEAVSVSQTHSFAKTAPFQIQFRDQGRGKGNAREERKRIFVRFVFILES